VTKVRRGRPLRGLLVFLVVACVGACQGELRLDDAPAGMSIEAGTDAEPGPMQDAPAESHDDDRPTGCTSDADCGLSTLHCDTASGSCVACISDTDCAGGADKRCDAALHECVECGVDGDCPTGQVCVIATARCATSCSSITDCITSGYVCDLTRDICVRCFVDEMCALTPATPKCAPDGTCVGCTSDSNCSDATPRCNQVNGSCVECVTSADCPGGQPLCDPTSLTCTSP
jgi:Cys-rich repeat protein